MISLKIARELNDHKTLKGRYKPRDPRFVTDAMDKAMHNGYEQWHRDLDDEVIAWLKDPLNKSASPTQFEAWLRERYSEIDLTIRFPNGLGGPVP